MTKILLFFSALCCMLNPLVFASETRIPVDPQSGVRLGQGFDARKMEWRDTCVSGIRIEQLSRESSIAAIDSSMTSLSYEQMQGNVSASVNLLGGLAGAKTKASVFSEWTESDRSTSSAYLVNFGASYVHLKNVKSRESLRDRGAFKKKCGTHFAISLETKHEVFFFLKHLSNDQEWLEKTRIEVKAKAAGGLIKKKWTSERIKEGSAAQATMKVGVQGSGYFRSVFKPVINPDNLASVECHFPDLEPCFRLSDFFDASMNSIRQMTQDGRLAEMPLLPDQFPTAVFLIPYSEASPDFASLESGDELISKSYFLNPLKSQLFELKSQAADLKSLEASPDDDALNHEISQLEQSILKCEKRNLCN